MREQADKETVLEKRFGSLNSSFVDVDDVGDFLKSIKGNSWRENDANQGKGNVVKTDLVKRVNERACKEIEIFEDSQNGEIEDERKDKPFFPILVRAAGDNFLADEKVHGGAADHECEKSPIPPAVKEIAGKKKKNILGAVIEAPVEQHDWDEEQEIGG